MTRDDREGRLAPINWIQWLTLILAVAFCGLIVWGIFGLEAARQDSNRSLRTILCYFEQRELAIGRLTPKQRRDAIHIYAHALSLVNEPACPVKGETP